MLRICIMYYTNIQFLLKSFFKRFFIPCRYDNNLTYIWNTSQASFNCTHEYFHRTILSMGIVKSVLRHSLHRWFIFRGTTIDWLNRKINNSTQDRNRKTVMPSKENGLIIIDIYIELHVQILFDYLPTYPTLFCSKIGILSREISR